MKKILHLIGAAYRLPQLIGYTVATHRSGDNVSHAKAAIAWLLEASRHAGDAGFSHSLHFARGWLPAYPETTGYIIPSLALAGRRYGVPAAIDAAAKARDWLARIQCADGGFADLAGIPRVFDTGQILIGVNFLAREGDSVATMIAKAATRWLVEQQSPDGSFVAHAYNDRPHAYYSRVGAALLDAGNLLEFPEARAAGMLNLEWTLAQQGSDGWFAHMSFAEHPPFSHTIVYTLEGLLAGYRLSGDARFLEAVVACADRLRRQIENDGGVIRSQYRHGFEYVDDQICVTGLCQWASLCFRLDRLGVDGFRSEGERSLDVAKHAQLVSPLSALNGGLPGSLPLSGRYMRFALPNWGVKFFLDALLESDGNELPLLS